MFDIVTKANALGVSSTSPSTLNDCFDDSQIAIICFVPSKTPKFNPSEPTQKP